ncbi:tetratricopeptide repeat protein [Myxococcota bacterium]
MSFRKLLCAAACLLFPACSSTTTAGPGVETQAVVDATPSPQPPAGEPGPACAAAAPLFGPCAGGDLDTCVELVGLYQEGDCAKAEVAPLLEALASGCDKGVDRACVVAGMMLDRGERTGADPDKARPLFEKGCELGSSPACWLLGMLYLQGKGVESDAKRALSLFEKSCDETAPPACVLAGGLHLGGMGGISGDEGRAVEMFEKGCKFGDPSACTALGGAYATGMGVEKDLGRAKALLEAACSQGGDKTACEALASMPKEQPKAEPAEPAKVELLEKGKRAKKKPLRYKVRPGTKQDLVLNAKGTVEITAGEDSITGTLPEITFHLAVKAGEPDDEGNIRFSVTLEKFDLKEGMGPNANQVAQQARESLKEATGLADEIVLTPSGVVKHHGTAMTGGAASQPFNPLDLCLTIIAELLMVPDEPVGNGGKWRVENRVYELTKRRRRVLSIKVDMEKVETQQPELGATTDVSGKAEAKIDLSKPLPVQVDMDLDTETRMQTKAGDEMKDVVSRIHYDFTLK